MGLVVGARGQAAGPDEQSPAAIDFSHDIVPLLQKHCVECHGGEKAEGGFSLNQRSLILESEAAEPGHASDSRIIELVSASDPEERMPPQDNSPLSSDEIRLLRRWINEGLKWEDGFSFAEQRYEPPLKLREVQVVEKPGSRNPIDQLLARYHKRLAERTPESAPPPRSKRLADAAFLRRVSLDLVGLLPTPDRLQDFLDNPDSDKRRRVVRELLRQDDAYAVHWLTFWNDLLRNDYTGTGYIDGGRKQISQWLYDALVTNKPYDQFVRELISPTPESEGFIRGIQWRGNVNASQTREVQFAQNISQVFLGINMKCASCHDSFIDRWTLKEAYGLAAIYSDHPLEIHRCDKPTGEIAQAAWIFPELGSIQSDATQADRLRQLAQLMTHRDNGRFARTIVNRLWHRLMGRGIVHPVDAMHTAPWDEDLLEYLAGDLVEHDYDLKRTLELIVTSSAYQSPVVVQSESRETASFVYRGPLTKRLTAEQFVDAIWQITQAGPVKPEAPIDRRLPDTGNQRFAVRAALVNSDLLMRSLGRPNREQVVTTRPAELTTLQAIDLANGQILSDMLSRGAQNLLNRDWSRSDELTIWIYQYALSRMPSAEELTIARQLLGDGSSLAPQQVEDLLWAVFMLPEFQLIR